MQAFLESVKGSAAAGRVEKTKGILSNPNVEILSPGDFVGTSVEHIEHGYGSAISAGTVGFIGRAITKANAMFGETAVSTQASNLDAAAAAAAQGANLQIVAAAAAQGASENFVSALNNAIGKKDSVQKVHVDVKVKMQGLVPELPQAVWPQSSAVDKLATEAARLVKGGIMVPFVFVDIKAFLPSWAELGSVSVDQQSDDEGEFNKGCQALAGVLVGNVDNRKSKRLDILKWQAAFDKYMLGAAAADQLSLAGAMAHKDICVQVALRASLGAPARRAGLGVIYDEVARRSWAQRAAAGDFVMLTDVSKAAMTLDPVLLREAEAIYDAAKPQNVAYGKFESKGAGKGKGKGQQCWKCGGWGHVSVDCQKIGDGGGKDKGKGKGKQMQCFKCGEFGHMAKDCRSGAAPKRNADGSFKPF